MLYEYEIVGKRQVKTNKDYILIDNKELYVKSIHIPKEYYYCTFLRKIDAIHGECIYLCFSSSRFTDNSFRIRHSDFGYVIVDIKSIMHELYIKESCNINLYLTEQTSDNVIYRIELR